MGFNIDESIGYKIELTERILKRESIKMLRKEGITVTPNHWVILYRLSKEEGLTQSEISKRTFKDTANITHILDLLVKKDLVERRSDVNDRRAFKVFLTDKGRSLMKQLPQIMGDNVDKATKGISKKDIETAKFVLQKICSNLGFK